MKFLFVVFILVGALFVDESVQDCRTSKRRIETSTFTPTDPTPGVRTVGFRFTYFDTRECDDSDKDGTTISRIYYQSESNSQTVKFWGEVEGVSGSEFSLDLAQWVGVRGNGDVIDLSDENLEFDSRGNCEGIESTIICTHNPGGFLGELEVSTNAKPVGDDPKLVVRLRDINWAGRDSALQLEFDLDGCLDDVTREDGVVSEEQRCSDDRAIVDFDSTYEYLGGSGVTSFDEGKEDSDLLVLLENSKRRDELGLSFSIQVLVPEELDGNLDSDDDDNNNENGDDNNNESGDDDDDSDSGASSLGTGFSIVCSLLFSLLFLLSN